MINEFLINLREFLSIGAFSCAAAGGPWTFCCRFCSEKLWCFRGSKKCVSLKRLAGRRTSSKYGKRSLVHRDDSVCRREKRGWEWMLTRRSMNFTFRWIFRFARQLNLLPQKSHLYLLIPVCVTCERLSSICLRILYNLRLLTMCWLSCPPRAKVLLQTLHVYGFSPLHKTNRKSIWSSMAARWIKRFTTYLWTRRCKRNLSLTGNCFPHS